MSSHLIHKIGPQIRTIRKAQSLRLIELAEKAKVSYALLSKIENGRMVPTLPKLLDIIRVLEVEPQDFFAELNGEEKFSGYLLIRQEDYTPYVKEESAVGFDYRSILEFPFDADVSSFQMSLVTLTPANSRPLVSTNALEFLYVISGTIEYHLGDLKLDLFAGDSLFFDGKIPHVPINTHHGPTTYLVAYFFLKSGEE